jgi:hypothetical protein
MNIYSKKSNIFGMPKSDNYIINYKCKFPPTQFPHDIKSNNIVIDELEYKNQLIAYKIAFDLFL